MAEYDTKSVLLLLLKEGENKTCIDCQTPQPQWASLSFGVFCCLTCSGAHRGLGVHISFVRSLTMDKWTDAQVTKMRVGGNAKCREFFESSPDYNPNMSIADKYTAHFAAQYKDKLLAEIEGRSWQPSDTPPPSLSNDSSLRKPRANLARTNSPIPRSGSGSPSMGYNQSSSQGGNGNGGGSTQKSRNEDYFANMGNTNDGRSSDLPPSQGGKYGGFGSDNSYNSNSNRGGGNSSIPSIDDLRDDPVAALSKGWGWFSNVASQASKSINESVVQPTLERATDPALQSQFSSYLSTATTAITFAGQKSGQALSNGLAQGSQIINRDLGYNVGDLGANFVGKLSKGNGENGENRGGYGIVGTFSSSEAMEEGEAGHHTSSDDFFNSQISSGTNTSMGGGSSAFQSQQSSTAPPPVADLIGGDSWASMAPNSASRSSNTKVAPPPKAPKTDDWDDWTSN